MTWVQSIVRQFLDAVDYLQLNGVTHRDIKPENTKLLNSGWDLKLFDFGCCVLDLGMGELKNSRCVGTIGYLAPEVIDGQYNGKCDLFSVGVISYIMFEGAFPYEGITIEAFRKALATEPKYEVEEWVDEAKELVASLLTLRPQDRPTPVQALDHPFFLKEYGADARSRRLSAVLAGTKSNLLLPSSNLAKM